MEKEIDYVLRNFASQEELMTIPKPAALPVITQLPAILPTPQEEQRPPPTPQKREREMISLPDLSVDKNKQLILIIDLDLTLVHAIHDDDAIASFQQWFGKVADETWVKEIQAQLTSLELFYVDDAGSSRMSNLLMKARPGVSSLLHELSARYELMIYTQGEAQYAEQVIHLLDPDGSLFKGRYIARGESFEEPQRKLLSKILDCWNSHVRNGGENGENERSDEKERSDENERKERSDEKKRSGQNERKENSGNNATQEHIQWNSNNTPNTQSSSDLTQRILTQKELEDRLLILDDKDDVWELNPGDASSNPLGHLVKCLPYFFFDTKGRYDLQRMKRCESLETDYMRRLTEIFSEVYTRWQRQGGSVVNALRGTRRAILRGLRVAFTSIIEQSEPVESNLLYQLLVECGGAYVTDLANCDLLVCRQFRTAKVSSAQLQHVPVVSVRWLEECAKFWRLAPLSPFFVDFKQDEMQTMVMGKDAVDAYHAQAKDYADTRLFTSTIAPLAYQALKEKDQSDAPLVDYDQLVLNELQQPLMDEKRAKLDASGASNFSPESRLQFSPPCQVSPHQ